MGDTEHEEWLKQEKARKAAKKHKSSPMPARKPESRKKDDGQEDEDFSVRSWVID